MNTVVSCKSAPFFVGTDHSVFEDQFPKALQTEMKGGSSGLVAMKSITSFFAKSPAPARQKETDCADGQAPIQKSHVMSADAGVTPPRRDAEKLSPNAESSGAKTTNKGLFDNDASARDSKKKRRRMVLDSDSDEEALSTTAGGGRVRTGASANLSSCAIQAALAAKAGAALAKVGGRVEILADGGDWLVGTLERHNISGTWKVRLARGGQSEVAIPSDGVRMLDSPTQDPRFSGKCTAPAKRKVYVASDEEEGCEEVNDPDFQVEIRQSLRSVCLNCITQRPAQGHYLLGSVCTLGQILRKRPADARCRKGAFG